MDSHQTSEPSDPELIPPDPMWRLQFEGGLQVYQSRGLKTGGLEMESRVFEPDDRVLLIRSLSEEPFSCCVPVCLTAPLLSAHWSLRQLMALSLGEHE